MPDQVIHHPKYGRGVVKGQMHRGLDLYVAFGDGFHRWIRATELTLSSPAQLVVKTPPHAVILPQQPLVSPPPLKIAIATIRPTPLSLLPHDQPVEEDSPFHSRRIVEAFRMGIVPDDCVASMTAGRDDEVERLQQWLMQNKGSALLVGDYGSGKSHLLRYLSLQALEQHYAVAWVQMEPNETPLYKPKRIYHDVAESLQYRLPGQTKLLGFRDLVRSSLENGALRDHEYFKHLLDESASDVQYEDMFWEWIEASEDVVRPIDWQEDPWGYRYNRFQYVPPMYGHTTAANIICYLLSGLAWAATHALGLKGVLVCIDEAESIDVSASQTQVDRGRNFLQGLVRVTNDDERMLGSPFHSDLVYSGTGIGPRIPFIYRKECGLRLVFGFTRTPELDRTTELRSAFRVDLESLDRSALATIFGWLRQHYSRAYNLEISDAVSAPLLDVVLRVMGNTRSFAKACVEILDFFRYRFVKL